jgi:ParB family transcriptional regulator, chromosome partitioning protein
MRKGLLNDLVGNEASEKLTAVNNKTSEPSRPAPLGSRGAVGAMRTSLAQLGPDRAAAVVEVDPGLIDDSIVPDRMRGAAADHVALVQAIREQGQQVPVLLRPKKDDPQRYQVAYGHRRVRALREIGKPVRAVVRDLTDEQLVIAQGQENNVRRDLSFIEKAMFGVALEDRGFDREKTIIPALSVDKTELSRLISVGRSIPAYIVAAIGPAPRAGRRRWMELAMYLETDRGVETARQLVGSVEFEAVEDSDARFASVMAAVAAPTKARRPKVRIWIDPKGRKIGRVERLGGRFVLSIDEKQEPGFGVYLEGRLTEIFRDYEARDDASTVFTQPNKES